MEWDLQWFDLRNSWSSLSLSKPLWPVMVSSKHNLRPRTTWYSPTPASGGEMMRKMRQTKTQSKTLSTWKQIKHKRVLMTSSKSCYSPWVQGSFDTWSASRWRLRDLRPWWQWWGAIPWRRKGRRSPSLCSNPHLRASRNLGRKRPAKQREGSTATNVFNCDRDARSSARITREVSVLVVIL